MTGSGPNPLDLFQQLQQVQRSMQEARDELEATTLDATAGGGVVRATVTGDGALRAISIDRSVVDPDDVEMLEDLVVAAVTEATRRAHELRARRLGAATGGLDLGALGSLLGGAGGPAGPGAGGREP